MFSYAVIKNGQEKIRGRHIILKKNGLKYKPNLIQARKCKETVVISLSQHQNQISYNPF
jgi:hypothetical protein